VCHGATHLHLRSTCSSAHKLLNLLLLLCTFQTDTVLLATMCDCDDCLGRTPYASLIATTVMCIGVGLFCGTGFRALDITLNGIFEGLFKYHVSWYASFLDNFL